MTLKTITVYASSSDRVDDIYKKAGFDLGVAIAREGWQQVNGGGSTGLMRSASDGALSVGGAVKVVILRHFAEKGYLHPEVEDVVYEENMPGRKKGKSWECELLPQAITLSEAPAASTGVRLRSTDGASWVAVEAGVLGH